MPYMSSEGMQDWLSVIQGLLLICASFLAHFWVNVFPIITALTAIFAFIIATHSVVRLAYRLFKGENTITATCDPVLISHEDKDLN